MPVVDNAQHLNVEKMKYPTQLVENPTHNILSLSQEDMSDGVQPILTG